MNLWYLMYRNKLLFSAAHNHGACRFNENIRNGGAQGVAHTRK